MTQRNIAVSIILTICTCGIYGIVWFIMLNDEVRNASKDYGMPTGGVAFLLTLITCGIYGFYWAYKMGKNIAVARQEAGLPATDNSVLYLVLQLFGFGIVNYALMQNEMNAITQKKWDERNTNSQSEKKSE